MTDSQYIALSAAVYSNSLPAGDNPDTLQPWTIADLIADNKISNYRDPEDNSIRPELAALSSLTSWQLISFQTSPNGFAAAAFKNPATGEIVFSFRGSEENLLDVDWWGTNAQIVTSLLIPAQLASAEDFVFETMNEHGPVCYESKTAMYDALSESSDVSFTGHSLGGALAQYMDPHNDNKTDMNAKVMVW